MRIAAGVAEGASDDPFRVGTLGWHPRSHARVVRPDHAQTGSVHPKEEVRVLSARGVELLIKPECAKDRWPHHYVVGRDMRQNAPTAALR